MHSFTIYSSVGGSLIESLINAYPGKVAEVASRFPLEKWHKVLTSGLSKRVWGRINTTVIFPAQVVSSAFWTKADILVPTTNPFFLPFLLVATKPFHGRAVVPLMYDIYPDALEADSKGRTNTAIVSVMTWMNRLLFKRATAVIFIGSAMAKHAQLRYGTPKCSTIIETGASYKDHENAKCLIPLADCELFEWCGDSIVVLYCGNMGRMHDIVAFGDGIPKFFRNQNGFSNVKVIIAASGQKVDALKNKWTNQYCDHIKFIPPLDYNRWLALLARAEISVVTLLDAAKYTSVPSKLYSAMAAGNAILAVAPVESDLSRTVESHKCGLTVLPEDSDGFATNLNRLITDKILREYSGYNGINAVKNHFDFEVLARKWAAFLENLPDDQSSEFDKIKRLVDMSVALFALTCSAPLMVVIAIAIRTTMGRPVFFRQTRPGKHGVPFDLIKFRTMRNPTGYGNTNNSDSERLTELGRFLRDYSLDELPTLFNVLKGDMSLIGPRPLLMSYLDRYTAEQARRHEVKPGVTGWAQVNGRNAISWDEKFKYDVFYVDNKSFALDLKIFLMTIQKVLKREGISHADTATMPEFMGSQVNGLEQKK